MSADTFAAASRKLARGIMFVGVLVGLASSVLAAETAPKSDLHTFTDDQGHTVQASITEVAEPNVYLQRGAGEPFKVKIDAFSVADQTFIRKWGRAHPTQKLPEVFQISAVPSSPSDPEDSPVQGFKVLLKNLSGKNLGALRMEYVLFRFSTIDASVRTPPTRQTGEILVKELRAANDVVVETDRMNSEGARLALWVRIYDHSNNLLQEWTSSPVIANEKWPLVSAGGNFAASSPDPAGR